MRLLRAIAAMMCLTFIIVFVITMFKPERDECDLLDLALTPINAVLFAVMALYAHQRMRGKIQ